jgi:hypothetical protein
MLSVIKLDVFVLSVVELDVFLLYFVCTMLSIMLSFAFFIITLRVIQLNVVMLNVMAPN